MPKYHVSRTRGLISLIIAIASAVLVWNPAQAATVSFPSPVHSALVVAARQTQVPVLGPTWLPPLTHHITVLNRVHRTYAAIVKANTTRYSITWWGERHAFAVNSPNIMPDTIDAAGSPFVSVAGRRYATRAKAHSAVAHAIFTMSVTPQTTISRSAQRITISSHILGWKWVETNRSGPVKTIDYLAWHERGWLVVTVPALGSGLIGTAQSFVSQIAANRPGQFGGIAIDPTGDSTVAIATWQQGRLMYTVTATWGVSTAVLTAQSMHRLAN